MNNEKLRKLLYAAEKYGAEAVYGLIARQHENGDSDDEADSGNEIARLIDKGTRRIISGKETVGNADGSLIVDPTTDLPM